MPEYWKSFSKIPLTTNSLRTNSICSIVLLGEQTVSESIKPEADFETSKPYVLAYAVS